MGPNEVVYRVCLALLFGCLKLSRAYHLRATGRGHVRAMLRRPGDTLAAGVASLLWEVAVGAYVVAPGWIRRAGLPLPDWLRLAGVALGIVELGAFICADRALGRNLSFTIRIRPDHHLVTHGPYRWVRHPIYSLLLVKSLVYCLVSANWLVGLLWLLGSALIAAVRIPAEERALLATFGDRYRAYMARTGGLLPRLPR